MLVEPFLCTCGLYAKKEIKEALLAGFELRASEGGERSR